MSFNNTDNNGAYSAYENSYTKPPSRLANCPVVKILLILNIAVFILEVITMKPSNDLIFRWAHFSVDLGIYSGQLWRFITFQFLHSHDSIMHIFSNMLGVFFFGPFVERWWGSKKFAAFYLLCGVAGALFYAFLLWIPGLLPTSDTWHSMIGASAGVYGILIAVAIIVPNLKVLLYFVLPLKIRYVAIGVLCIATYVAITDGNNAGGEAAHIGGAILGFILMKCPQLLSFVEPKYAITQRKRGRLPRTKYEPKLGPRVSIDLNDTEVDKVLDKVNREGLQSLTESEKDLLKRSAGN